MGDVDMCCTLCVRSWLVLDAEECRSAAGCRSNLVFSNTHFARVYEYFPSLIPERYLSPENNIKHFVKALAERDADALKEHVGFPFKREYPLHPIKTIEEFVAAIPQLFEEEDIKGMQDIDEWESVGWRGYMYKNGLVWLSEDFCLTAAGGWRGSEKEHELWLE